MAMEVLPQRKRRRVAPNVTAPAAVVEHHRTAEDSAAEESHHADAVSEEDADLPSSEDANEQEAGQTEEQRLPKQLQKLQRLKQAYEQRGVVYISRIPPHMVRTGRNPLVRSSGPPVTSGVTSSCNRARDSAWPTA